MKSSPKFDYCVLQYGISPQEDLGLRYVVGKIDQKVCLHKHHLTDLLSDLEQDNKKDMNKKYHNPPIIETVCEFRLTPDSNWDLTVPGLIYEKVKDEFKTKEQGVIQELEIAPRPSGLPPKMRTGESVRFLSDDKLKFIRVGPRVLAIHCLRPYPSWGGFKPMVEKAFQALTSTTQVEIFQRIGLMYVNRIEIPSSSTKIKLEEYFEFRPFLGLNLPQDMTNFIVGCQLPFFDGRDMCRIELTRAIPGKPKHLACILMLDYSLAKSQAVSVTDVPNWIESAHQNVVTIFEGCITDRLRELFEVVK